MAETNENDGGRFGAAKSMFANAVNNAGEKLNAGKGQYKKSDEVRCGCSGADNDQSEYIHSLRSDLANCYYWTGSFMQDYFFFVANWHPVIGILLCHPDHPWTKRERLQMTVISLAITLIPSVEIAKAVPKELQLPATIMGVTIPDTIIGVVLYQLSIADSRCPPCAAFWNFVNKCCMNCILVIGLISAGIAYSLLQGTDVDLPTALKPLVMGKIYSWATWFPIWFVLPCMGFAHEWYMEYKAEKKKEEEEANPE